MIQENLPDGKYQWVRYKIFLESKYLHLVFRIYANSALFKYTDYLSFIEFESPNCYHFTIFLPINKHQSCKRDLYEQIMIVQIEYEMSRLNNENIHDIDSVITIESDNYIDEKANRNSSREILFECEMSKTIIHCLKNETIDADAIFCLALYKHLILIKHYKMILGAAKAKGVDNFYDYYKEDASLNSEIANHKYREIKGVMNQVVNDVFGNVELEADSWVTSISALFNNEIQSSKMIQYDAKIVNFSTWNYPSTINRALGITGGEVQILNFLVRKSLEQ